MNTKITTIIPFFNSEDSLSRMLDSILQGTIIPYEILLIDDGSSDNSPSIAQVYASRYPFIKYIQKEHAGVSAARNLGIQIATGDYISFLDADDYIEGTMYEQMIGTIDDNVSGCVCGYFTEKDGISTEYYSTCQSYTSNELLKAMFTDNNVQGFLFTRLFKTSLIKNYRFDANIGMCEDLLFQTKLLSNNPDIKFACVNKAVYHYVQNSQSATGKLQFFSDGTFKYKPAFAQIKKIVSYDYIDESYDSILQYSMYSLLKAYKNGNKQLISQIRLLQQELKTIKVPHKTKRRFGYTYAPVLMSHLIK